MTKRPCLGAVERAVMDLLLVVLVVVRVLLLEVRRSAAAAMVEGDLTTRTAVERVVSDENMFFVWWLCKVFVVERCVKVRERFIAAAAEGERKVDRQANCLYSCRMEGRGLG